MLNETGRASFIHRFPVKAGGPQLPRDLKRLRISPSSFRWLLAKYNIPSQFVSDLSHHDVLPGSFAPWSGAREQDPRHNSWAWWFILPVRIAAPCQEVDQQAHSLGASGSNQSNPASYLHLDSGAVDIRPSRIAVFLRQEATQTYVVCVDFADGRYPEFLEEPLERMRECLQFSIRRGTKESAIALPTVLFSSTVRWWKDVLSHSRAQLMQYEKDLIGSLVQQGISLTQEQLQSHYNSTAALCNIRSHLQRYQHELEVTLGILSGIREVIADSAENEESNENLRSNSCPGIDDLAASFRGYKSYCADLERISSNAIDLAFRISASASNKAIVHNVKWTKRIMKSARAQTISSQRMMNESQQMAKEMRKDSVSMKTIALLTMLFLPATSFAAILSMPFFDNLDYLEQPTKVWIWVALTVPATLLTIFWYIMYSKHNLRRGDNVYEMEEADLSSVNIENDE